MECVVSKNEDVYWAFELEDKDELEHVFELGDTNDNEDMVHVSTDCEPPCEYVGFAIRFSKKRPVWFSDKHLQKIKEARTAWKNGLAQRVRTPPSFYLKKDAYELPPTERDLHNFKKWIFICTTHDVGAIVTHSFRSLGRHRGKAFIKKYIGDDDYTGLPYHRDFCMAALGSHLICDRKSWEGAEDLPVSPEYPFQPAYDLWNKGFFPVVVGDTWFLLGNRLTKTVYKITKKELAEEMSYTGMCTTCGRLFEFRFQKALSLCERCSAG